MKIRIVFALITILGLMLTPTTGLAVTAPTCGLSANTPPCCYAEETGWGDGERYVPQGNWATYTPYYGYAQTVTLYAGRTMEAGTIYFSDPVDGMVTIDIVLNNTWHFDFRGPGGVYEDAVHIQDYMDPPPHVNPAPGQFDYSFFVIGLSFSTTLPVANYYGIHTALIHVIPCPPIMTSPAAAFIR